MFSITPAPQIVSNYQSQYRNGQKIHQHQSHQALAFGSALTFSSRKDAQNFIAQKRKEDAQVRSRVFYNPSCANSLSLTVYQIRICCTNCHNPALWAFGLMIFMWIFCAIAVVIWTIFFILIISTLLAGLFQLIQFAFSKCTKKCKTRRFQQTCFSSGLKVCGDYFIFMICIGFQPKK